MRNETIKVYRYEELGKKEQEKVLNRMREQNDFPFLYDDLLQTAKEELKKNKIEYEDLKLMYSLSYCQGDGLQINGIFYFKNKTIRIKQSGHYYHLNAVTIETTDKNGEIIEDDKKFIEIYEKICKLLEKNGYDYIEFENSEDNIKENLEANDYEFLANGDVFRSDL